MTFKLVLLSTACLSLLDLPAASAASEQSPTPVHVSRIVVTGNTVLPQDVITSVTKDYEGRDLDLDAIEDLRHALTLAYIKHGYVASGAVVPKQDIGSGTLTVDVIEGYAVGMDVSVVQVGKDGHDQDVTGKSSLRRYVCDRLLLPPGGLLAPKRDQRRVDVTLCDRPEQITEGPINMDILQRRVAEMLQDPGIARLNVEVRPGGPLGEAIIAAKVVETAPWSLYVSIANDEPPDIGLAHGEVGGTARNLIDYGDALSLSYGRTEGANFASARYEIPINRYDTRVALYGSYNGAGVVSAAFSGLGITSQDKTAGVLVLQPLLHDGTQTLNASLFWDYIISDQYLLGQPFSFSPGYVNGHAEAAAAHASLDWTHQTETQVISLRGTISHGLNIFGATNLQSAPNPDYTTVLGQVQYAQRWGQWQLIARAAGQLSSEALYSFDQVAIGGSSTVRGYVQNALIRDSGFIGSVELREAVARLAIPGLAADDRDGGIDLGVFFDEGQGWNHHGASAGPGGISSVGLGLLWQLRRGLSARIYYGYGLTSPRDTANLLQPISFALRMEF